MTDPQWPRASAWLAEDSDDPGLVVAGVPTAVASMGGSAGHLAPGAFRRALAGFSTFHGEAEVDLEELAVKDLGDWDVADLDIDASQTEIERLADGLADGPVYAFSIPLDAPQLGR